MSAPAGVPQPGRQQVDGSAGTQASGDPRLHLVGDGDWTGPAPATLIGVGRCARDTAGVIVGLQTGAG